MKKLSKHGSKDIDIVVSKTYAITAYKEVSSQGVMGEAVFVVQLTKGQVFCDFPR